MADEEALLRIETRLDGFQLFIEMVLAEAVRCGTIPANHISLAIAANQRCADTEKLPRRAAMYARAAHVGELVLAMASGLPSGHPGLRAVPDLPE